jgi:glycine/D-amino acid oxidase-like deaminating enzyme
MPKGGLEEMDMTENRNRIQQHAPHPHKVAVVGAGKVGSTFAYALLLSGLVGEMVLIDVDRERVEGEAMDLNHAVPLSNPVRIWWSSPLGLPSDLERRGSTW